MATHSSILAWGISWKEEPGRLQSMGLQRVRHVSHLANRRLVVSVWHEAHLFLALRNVNRWPVVKCLIVAQLSPASGRGKDETVSFDSCRCSVAKWCPTLRSPMDCRII